MVQGRSINPRTLLEAHALHGRGWSILAIAPHLKTIRAYLSRAREPGVRRKSVPDPIDPFVEYCRIHGSRGPPLTS